MPTVGVRELKSRLSEYLKRVAAEGERIVVTDRGRPVAVITPAASEPNVDRLEELLGSGLARWSGGKPRGARRLARLVHGPSVAEAISEDRG